MFSYFLSKFLAVVHCKMDIILFSYFCGLLSHSNVLSILWLCCLCSRTSSFCPRLSLCLCVSVPRLCPRPAPGARGCSFASLGDTLISAWRFKLQMRKGHRTTWPSYTGGGLTEMLYLRPLVSKAKQLERVRVRFCQWCWVSVVLFVPLEIY